MATTTTNYGLLKPASTDTYNHLIYDNPNMDAIDAQMKLNSDHGVTPATCVKSGTVHTIVRSNTDAPVFRFTATGDWNSGDTMTVDGVTVSVFLPNGAAAIDGAYLINSEVIASIVGTRVTLMSNAINALQIPYGSTNVSDALDTNANDISTLQTDVSGLTDIKYMKISTDATSGSTANYYGYFGAVIDPSTLSGISVNKIVGVLVRSVSLPGYMDIVLFTQYNNKIIGLAKAANVSIHFDITVLYVD